MTIDTTNHRLFILDSMNNRVLEYDLNSTNQLIDKIPDHVLGQPDFVSNAAVTTQSGMNDPLGIAYDVTNQRLFVADYFNSRVMVFNVSAIINGQNATNVLGESSFVANNPVTTQAGMKYPTSLAYDTTNQRLFVTEMNNNRVTVFNVATITNGQNAVNVLGVNSNLKRN